MNKIHRIANKVVHRVQAAEGMPDWLRNMSKKHQNAYFKEHPESKYAPGGGKKSPGLNIEDMSREEKKELDKKLNPHLYQKTEKRKGPINRNLFDKPRQGKPTKLSELKPGDSWGNATVMGPARWDTGNLPGRVLLPIQNNNTGEKYSVSFESDIDLEEGYDKPPTGPK